MTEIIKKEVAYKCYYNIIKENREADFMGGLEQDRVYNFQINYIIIDKLWCYLGNKTNDLYFKIGITANKYSKIRSGDIPLAFLEKKWNEQNSPLKKFSLPKEIMLGYSAIAVNNISREDWLSYLDARYGGSEENRKNNMRNFNNKLNKAFAKLENEKNLRSNIGTLYCFIKYGVSPDLHEIDREMKELYASLRKVTTENIKNCDDKLREEIHRYMKEVLYKIDVITAYNNITNTENI
ncbi:MAG: hypothetical protein K2N95_01035 [Lachnospiraceae bacterium]|nr:hypothetical protein [Lachnospiraceae bacterium]